MGKKAGWGGGDKEKKILYVLEFKRTTDQREEYEEGARVHRGRKAV